MLAGLLFTNSWILMMYPRGLSLVTTCKRRCRGPEGVSDLLIVTEPLAGTTPVPWPFCILSFAQAPLPFTGTRLELGFKAQIHLEERPPCLLLPWELSTCGQIFFERQE